MAKETKEQKPAKAQETTVDNVVEQLRAKNLQSSTSVQAALEKMQKETEEKKPSETEEKKPAETEEKETEPSVEEAIKVIKES